MAIWKKKFDLDILKHVCNGCMVEYLSIEFIEFSDDSLTARMPVNERTKQPLGQLHGGATCVLAETVASVAANLCVDSNDHFCVGLEINCNHVKAVDSGYVYAKTWPHHTGKTTQVWQIEIRDDAADLVAIARLSLIVRQKTGITDACGKQKCCDSNH